MPQDRSLFPDMTVRENLRMGGYILRDRHAVERRIDEVMEMFPILRERRAQLAKTMSGGQQQMLLLGRALVLKPRIIMLDEPSLGLAPMVSHQIFEFDERAEEGRHHHHRRRAERPHRARISPTGAASSISARCVFEGPSQTVLDDPRIEELYLGRRRRRTGTGG